MEKISVIRKVYNTIHVTGASGAGTTTLGQALERKYGYKWLDSDDFFWMPTDPPFIKLFSLEKRVELMSAALRDAPKCVISGSLCGWGDCFITKFDLVIFIDTPTDIRIDRLKKREAVRFGGRIHYSGDMYDAHTEFIEWASVYDTAGVEQRSRALHEEWFKKLSCLLLRLDGTKPVEQLLEKVGSFLHTL